jgi:hypothetical protein
MATGDHKAPNENVRFGNGVILAILGRLRGKKIRLMFVVLQPQAPHVGRERTKGCALHGFNHSNRMARQRIDRAIRPSLRYTSCLAQRIFRMRNSAKNKDENGEILRPRSCLGCLQT